MITRRVEWAKKTHWGKSQNLLSITLFQIWGMVGKTSSKLRGNVCSFICNILIQLWWLFWTILPLIWTFYTFPSCKIMHYFCRIMLLCYNRPFHKLIVVYSLTKHLSLCKYFLKFYQYVSIRITWSIELSSSEYM